MMPLPSTACDHLLGARFFALLRVQKTIFDVMTSLVKFLFEIIHQLFDSNAAVHVRRVSLHTTLRSLFCSAQR